MYHCLAQGLSFKIGQGNVLTLSPPLIIRETISTARSTSSTARSPPSNPGPPDAMQNLLNLLAGRIAARLGRRTSCAPGILRIYGGDLRRVLRHSVRNRFFRAARRARRHGLIQSSTATALIVAAFAGQA
jgi:hypothetical protein